jgi:thiazole synthase ThiGH ThiG subunit
LSQIHATDDLPDRLAAAVLAVEGVADLHGGVFGEVATYLPGRRVRGIRITDRGCEIHVVLSWGAPIGATTGAVRRAAASLVDGPVDVTVEDLTEPPGETG